MKTLEKQSPQVQVIQELKNGDVIVHDIVEIFTDPGSGLETIKLSGNTVIVKGDE